MFKKLLLLFTIVCIGSINAMESVQSNKDKSVDKLLDDTTIKSCHDELKQIYAEKDTFYDKAKNIRDIFKKVFEYLGISPDKFLSEDLNNKLFKLFGDIEITNDFSFPFSTNVYEAMIGLFVNQRTELILYSKNYDKNEKIAEINPSNITDNLVKELYFANTDSKDYDLYFTITGKLYIESKRNLNTYEPLFNKKNKKLNNKIEGINYKNLVTNLLKIVKAKLTGCTDADKFEDMINNKDFSAIHDYILQGTYPIKKLVKAIINYAEDKTIDLNTYKLKLIKLLYSFYNFQYKRAKCFLTTYDENKFISYSEYYNGKDGKFSNSQCKILMTKYNRIALYLSKQMENFEKTMNNNFIDNFEEINNINNDSDAISEDNNIGNSEKIKSNNFDDFEIIE